MLHLLALKHRNASALRYFHRQNTHKTPSLQLNSIQHRDFNSVRRWMFKSIFGNIDGPPETKTMEEALQRIKYLDMTLI